MPTLLFDSDSAAAAFASSLNTAQIGKRIDYRQRTGSTNDLALQAARDGAAHGLVFVAEAQDAGRGRRGRRWESPPRLGLLFTVLVRHAALGGKHGPMSGWIPLVTGLACAEAIASACELSVNTKWPNDVVVPCDAAPGWRKLGGILCESAISAGSSHAASAAESYVVIGIGLNVNHAASDLPPSTHAAPTSALAESGRQCDRAQVLRAVLERLEQHLIELHHPTRGAALKQRIEDRLRQWWSAQRVLHIQAPANGAPVAAHFVGLDRQGQLLVQDERGRHKVLADAEILKVC
jgi:BirA family biotin operon repressor/biotin-[acetyl-CoA-carboxylase] ligase